MYDDDTAITMLSPLSIGSSRFGGIGSGAVGSALHYSFTQLLGLRAGPLVLSQL